MIDPVEKGRQLCELTRQAISACENDDWQLTQSLINQRDEQLDSILSQDTTNLPEQGKYALRDVLEKLHDLNALLSQLTMQSRNQLSEQKSRLEQNVKAINSYLDHS